MSRLFIIVICDVSPFWVLFCAIFGILLDLVNSNVIIYCVEKSKKLYLFSLGFLIASLIFIAILVFAKIVTRDDEYILAERIFSQGIKALFFYLAYAFGVITLTMTILSTFKNIHLLQRSSFFLKVCFVIILVSPFFTSIYYEYAHEASFFKIDILAIAFLIISTIIEYFAIKDIEENTYVDELIDKYRIVINFDYFLLIISALLIIIFSFVVGDFYIFSNNYLPNIPFYYLPALSLVFYIFNSYKLTYIESRYFSLFTIINSRFSYYFVSYLSIIRLGYFAYSNYSFYEGAKTLRLVLFIIFISVIIFNSVLPKIDLSFILASIIVTLFIFEVVGMIQMINNDNNIIFILTSYLLDYIIVLFIALPYYIYNGINHLFLKRK